MVKKQVAVVVPAYKTTLSDEEVRSLRQCLSVLHKYDIFLIYPENMDIAYYRTFFNDYNKELNVKAFPSPYFESVNSYNKLMLDLSFYNAFQDYEYILIYQLDAYVFEDKLEYWCNKGYDYIGAPWLTDFGKDVNQKDLYAVGNGGFSLRKVNVFISVLQKKRLRPFRNIYKELMKSYNALIYGKKNVFKKAFLFCYAVIKSVGYNNSTEFWKKQFGFENNEDVFWTLQLENFGAGLRMPSVNEALSFSFEQSPSSLFELNDKKLPFGCHAWHKYEYETFWKKIIS